MLGHCPKTDFGEVKSHGATLGYKMRPCRRPPSHLLTSHEADHGAFEILSLSATASAEHQIEPGAILPKSDAPELQLRVVLGISGERFATVGRLPIVRT